MYTFHWVLLINFWFSLKTEFFSFLAGSCLPLRLSLEYSISPRINRVYVKAIQCRLPRRYKIVYGQFLLFLFSTLQGMFIDIWKLHLFQRHLDHIRVDDATFSLFITTLVKSINVIGFNDDFKTDKCKFYFCTARSDQRMKAFID